MDIKDIENKLNLKGLPKQEEKKDIFSIFEASMSDLYPKVPDPEFDYLFTNWGDKVPEEPYDKAEKSRKSDIKLEKPLKKKILRHFLDLSSDQKDVVEKIMTSEDPSMKRLVEKGWEKWNPVDWKNAQHKLKGKRKPQDVGPILRNSIDINYAPTEDILRARSNALVEMKLLDFMYKGLATVGHASTDKIEGKEKIYKHIDDIVKKSMDDVRPLSPSKYDENDVMGINYKLKIGKKEYAIHTHLVKESKIFLFSLWDKDENRLLLMLCEGYLREDHLLIATAKNRLKSWMRDHGSN